MFELTLTPDSQVVNSSNETKLKYKLKNIQLEYDMIRSPTLAEEARSAYASGTEFLYDHVMCETVVTFAKGTMERINHQGNPERQSLKGILLLFIKPYTAGTMDSEKYINPDLTKVSVTMNCFPNMVYNDGTKGKDMGRGSPLLWEGKKTKHST